MQAFLQTGFLQADLYETFLTSENATKKYFIKGYEYARV
jgi:hypothetical protein